MSEGYGRSLFSEKHFPHDRQLLPPFTTTMSLGSFFSFPASSAFFDRKKDDGVIDNPNVELVNRNLWSTFLECGTEMIITKKGRLAFVWYILIF